MNYRPASALKAAIPFTLLLFGCGDDPLPQPALLNHPEEQWPVRTEKMTTREIFEVYRYYRSLKPPRATVGAELLGARGKEALLVWAESVERNEQPLMTETMYFERLVIEAAWKGGYDLCADAPMMERAAKLMAKEAMARSNADALSYVKRQCAKAK